ncbi:hypothetical protein PVK06_012746 [Gossypium arboreum]|uniref:DUF4283 domain-containing protein n=1 Tax=Gossypium arboreum TaxID=29729 RepID=A0ABR0QCB0_GOSAR|nr:hypothetical protein PVK06_012746 [Gossypium arboreum]
MKMVSKWMFLMDKKVSFKEELIGSVPKTQTVREDEYSELLEGDVITKAVDGVPSIHSLDRVNWFIERRMILSVIIKLLGRKMGFAASINRVQGLWKTMKPFQLMDLENDYYLVKFQDERDYSNALTKGPWTVFG